MKWIIDLSLKVKAVRLPEENTGEHFGFSRKNFLGLKKDLKSALTTGGVLKWGW